MVNQDRKADFKKGYRQFASQIIGTPLLPLLSVFFGLYSCSEPVKDADFRFEQLNQEQTGVIFSNTLKNSPQRNILNYIYYYNGGGVACGDFNNDGLIDLYFTANETPDALYLNQGDFKFIEVSAPAGIIQSGWSTGVTTVDINQDGLLDVYVCKVAALDSVSGGNKLYVNQGVDANKTPIFKEAAADYGLDFKGYATQASFFDYDLDGDLDMFLLNHAVNPNSNYGRGTKRFQTDVKSGDRLYQNQEGVFKNVSEQAGILQSPIGYGLGLGVSDLNNDGYPDIYVGNDFFENDYLYINNKNGTFTEQISSDNNPMGHTSHYSMGNDLADLNNDGLSEIYSVDMLPEDLQTYKSSGVEFGYSIYQNYLKNGYAPQYMQNNLHYNYGQLRFKETAYLSGVSATEWSWSPLLADFDNDGLKDIFISNGIVGATNDMDFINFIADESIQKKLADGMSSEEMAFIEKIPEKKTPNYFFKNVDGYQFENTSDSWAESSPSFSNGAAYADLDNDGDLDLITNNVNQPAQLYRNRSRQSDSLNYLTVKLAGVVKNRRGIGAKVTLYLAGKMQSKELFPTRGYLSAVDPRLHFGLGTAAFVDSIHVRWPGGGVSAFGQVQANQQVVIEQDTTDAVLEPLFINGIAFLNTKETMLFKHRDNTSLEFNWDPLIAYASTNEGPGIAVGDINNDGIEDLFFCGGKGQPSQLMAQNAEGAFTRIQEQIFTADALAEDIDALFADFNADGYTDLIVVPGGNEFTQGEAIQPRLYLNSPAGLVKTSSALPKLEVNASSVSAIDYDNDGDLDLSVSVDGLAKQFGSAATQYLLQNDGRGNFTDVTAESAPGWIDLGKVKQILWNDFNADGWPDALVIGHWMPLQLYLNNRGSLELQDISALKSSSGLWETAAVADFDGDGDLDIVAGNWGLNSRLSASQEQPLMCYRGDFNGNGSEETLITYYYQDQQTLLSSKDELAKQIPQLNKDFLSYRRYAQAKTTDLFPQDLWNKAASKAVSMLATSYFENLGGGEFNITSLPFTAQISPVNDIFVYDFNSDGFPDIFTVGNRLEVSTQIGRLDAAKGQLFLFDPTAGFLAVNQPGLNLNGSTRAIQKITINNQPHLIVSRNNDSAVVLEISNDVIQIPNE